MRKGYSMRYDFEGENMDLQIEIEEAEARFQNIDGYDDETIDPDASFSDIDDKIQNVLVHCQKDLEGGLSAENLGVKIWEYGSFLHPNTQPKALYYNAPVSPNYAPIEVATLKLGSETSYMYDVCNGGNQISVSHSNESQTERKKSGSTPMKSKSNSNLLTKRNDEICSGTYESPTSILEMMTSFPVLGSVLLSPLTYDLLHLTENKSDDKGSQESVMTVVHGSDLVKVDQNVVGKKSMLTEEHSVSMETTNRVLPKKETSLDNFAPGNKASSSRGKKKTECDTNSSSVTSKTKNNDNWSKKVKETYKDFFGELDIELEHNDEMALEGINVKGALDNNSFLKERLNGRKNRNFNPSTMGIGLESDAAERTVVPVVNEDWVCCDKCEKWRLLPPGVNPGHLPEKWICNMLDWLPGMDRCNISEKETTKATTCRFPGPSVQGSKPVHLDRPHSGVISRDGAHQNLCSEIPSSSKKKHGLNDSKNEAMRDGRSLSSTSSKKKHHSSHKTKSLNGVNRSSLVNEVEFQDSGRSRAAIMENDKLKPEENNKLYENFVDEGNNIHHLIINNKSESTQDFPKNFKKEDAKGGTSHTRKLHKRNVSKKRIKVKEFDGKRKHVKETSETNHRNEKKSKVMKSVNEGSKSKETSANNMSSKGSEHNKKSKNQKGNRHVSIKNSTPEKQKERIYDPTVVLVRDLSNQATTNALREATNLKLMADRLKNNGSSLESRALFMEAALKFLHVANLFESCHSQTGRYGDMIQSVSIYDSTAKLCKYCAHEYERTKEMAVTSLAYKCMEVAYMKVVYSSIATSCKDVKELQMFLHIDPTGDSPFSSACASDLHNLNNKSTLAKGVNVPQVAENHIIADKIKPNFTRILTLIQNVNSAIEASRKSRIAFEASSLKEEAVVSAIKRALDFSFQDVEELLHRVRLAIELINR